MAITAAQVKQLREMTGAGIMDCKKALTKTNGDMDAAVDELRKVAGAKVEKKASRIAAEGLSIAAQDGDKTAVVVEVNSETDFVASNEKFKEFVNNVAKQVLASDAKTVDELKKEKWVANPEQTVDEALTELIGVISEKLSIRRFEKVVAQNGIVASYVHGGGRIAVIVEADTDVVNDEIKIVENDLVAEGLGNVVKMDQLVIQLINPPDLYSGCAGVEWIRDRSPKSIHYIILPGE